MTWRVEKTLKRFQRSVIYKITNSDYYPSNLPIDTRLCSYFSHRSSNHLVEASEQPEKITNMLFLAKLTSTPVKVLISTAKHALNQVYRIAFSILTNDDHADYNQTWRLTFKIFLRNLLKDLKEQTPAGSIFKQLSSSPASSRKCINLLLHGSFGRANRADNTIKENKSCNLVVGIMHEM